MMGLEQQAAAFLWERTKLVFHAKKGRPHKRILFHCVCTTTIYHISLSTPSALYVRYLTMQHLTPLSSANYEPF